MGVDTRGNRAHLDRTLVWGGGFWRWGRFSMGRAVKDDGNLGFAAPTHFSQGSRGNPRHLFFVKVWRCLAIVGVICGCAELRPREPTPTGAIISRFESVAGKPAFRGCTVHLRWTARELAVNCGEPTAAYPRVGGGNCFAYPTSAHPVGEAAPTQDFWVLVCFDRELVCFDRESEGRMIVESVYGLSKLPDAPLP